jgi:diadenylate cyclase
MKESPLFPEALQTTIDRLLEYTLWEVVVEVAAVWVLVYIGYRFVRGTRAAGAFKGVLVLLIITALAVRVLEQTGLLPRISALYDSVAGLAAIALIVTFQPELRRALIRLGEGTFFRFTQAEVRPVADAVVEACSFLSKTKFGAIIAIERSTGLRELIEGGVKLDADVSSKLLMTIFTPNTALHDMGVVIRGGKIVAASVQFPLADPADLPDEHLGTRHRAAVGLAKVSDAIVIVVSEETGAISIAEGRDLRRWLSPDQLRDELLRRMSSAAPPTDTEDSGQFEGAEDAAAAEAAAVAEKVEAQQARAASKKPSAATKAQSALRRARARADAKSRAAPAAKSDAKPEAAASATSSTKDPAGGGKAAEAGDGDARGGSSSRDNAVA